MLDREEARPAVGRKSRAKLGSDPLPSEGSSRYRVQRGGWKRCDRKLKDGDLDRVLEALRRTHGIRKPAAKLLRVSPVTLYKYLREHPELDDDLKQITEELVDDAETELIKALKRGDVRAIQMILFTKGRDRGWNQRFEATGPNGTALVAGPSVGDMVRVLEQVLERRQDPPPLAPPPPALLDLSAEIVPADQADDE